MSSPATREQLKDWCFQNKYTKWYFSIIENAENRYNQTDKNYKEKHHILPKSIFKNNDTVYLTAREHFICHMLLPKMLKNKKHKRKMKLALHRLTHGNKNQIYCKSSKIYSILKKWHSEAAKERTNEYWSNISKEKRSEMKSGSKNGRYGKEVSIETREKISKANKGRLKGENHPLWKIGHSQETKNKMSMDIKASGKNKGKNNPMFGKIGAAKNKKWYHDPINNVERYFLIDSQPINFKEGRLRRVYSN